MTNEELLSQLNESQRKAVEYIEGPSLVIAGAGSGKTRVLTYKIAYLLQNGFEPWSILALTFTNKAANEMKERIGKLVNHDLAKRLQMGTFHSIFARILRGEAEHIGYNSNFTIYDETDSRSLIKAIVKEMQLDDKVYKPAAVHSKISMAKNHLIRANEYANDKEVLQRDTQARMPSLFKIYLAYEQRCQKANAMDFDDLLVLTYILFRDHPDIRQKWADRFDYVLVDEYQDTNYAQQCIVLQLTKQKQRVCAVGDDSQSIYSFRGANIDNILNFREEYDNAQLFKLEQNYRSTQRIVEAANSLIKHNSRQIPKDVFSKNAEGEKLVYKPAYSDKEESLIVCKDIKRIRKEEGGAYSDFAILYRTNSQSRSFEEELRKQNIPYRLYGGLSFYQRKEIKDIIAYFRLIANPDDEEAFKRIINYPARGIGQTTVNKIALAAQEQQVSFWQVICSPEHYGLNVNKGTLAKIDGFRNLISAYVEKMPMTDVYTLGTELIKESGISKDIFSTTDTEGIARQENLEEFLSGMQTFVEERREEDRGDEIYLTDYLQDVALLTDLDSDNGDDNDRVTMMTIHAAKGLEFPTVFIVGLEENIFPSPMSASTPRELEEERRLLYVAITRAEKHCIITNAKNRWRYGKMEFDTPSRFLAEIDPDLMEEVGEETSYSSSRSNSFSGGYDSDYRYNRFRDQMEGPEWAQNNRPVADRFMADPKPKITGGYGSQSRSDYSRKYSSNSRPQAPSMPRPTAPAGFKRVTTTSTSAPVARNSSLLHEGNRIEHQRFGVGTVVKVEGTGENAKATVDFVNSGRKQLLLKFAKFTIVG